MHVESPFGRLHVGSTKATRTNYPGSTEQTALDLPPVFSPTNGAQMPRHRFLVRPDSARRNVDIQPWLDHPNIVQAPQPGLKLSFEFGDLNR